MNQELLISLEKQAEKHTLDIPCPLDDAYYTALFNEQLVKLVVQECMERIKVVIAEEAMNVNSDYFYYDFKQHFGVE